jgi:bifunctional ADP-heptose synthase (sugar kinase/adenylyltransferase)
MLFPVRKNLIETIKTFSPRKIMVVGDLMLDHYIWGKVERISPEAPSSHSQDGERKF